MVTWDGSCHEYEHLMILLTSLKYQLDCLNLTGCHREEHTMWYMAEQDNYLNEDTFTSNNMVLMLTFGE